MAMCAERAVATGSSRAFALEHVAQPVKENQASLKYIIY
jgi:hypothetical protein